MRIFENPSRLSVSFSVISTCPLYSILFYSHDDGKIYSYSLNGQFLDEYEEKSGFLYNFTMLSSS